MAPLAICPAASAWVNWFHWRSTLAAAVARMRGRLTMVSTSVINMIGTTSRTHSETTALAHGLRTLDSGRFQRVGSRLRSVGPIR